MNERRKIRRPNTALRQDPLEWLRLEIESIPSDGEEREAVVAVAEEILAEIASERQAAQALTHRLAEVSAETAELVAELDERNHALDDVNRQLARTNAHAAELVAEVETQAEQIEQLNRALGGANAVSSELVAELELQREELESVNATLGQSNEEKANLLGVVAHDLRAGIGGIQGLASLLQETTAQTHREPENDTASHVASIAQESRRLLQLLGSLLDVSRIENSRLDLAPERMSLLHVVREAVRFHGRLAEAKEQRIVLRDREAEVETLADPVRVRQVLDNVLSNAIKYSPAERVITVEVWKTDDEVGVDVLDEGPGFQEGDLDRLFTSFQTLSAKPTGGEDSHGLGLVISRKIADLHEGRLEASNREEATGACFRFALPMHRLQEVSRHILLAEDNKVLRFLLVNQLEKLNHKVRATESGVEALAAWTQHCFDLILMDLQMPDMDGLEAAPIIRARESTGCRTPIVALTAHTDIARHQEALNVGIDACETKPITGERLQALIDEWVDSPPSD